MGRWVRGREEGLGSRCWGDCGLGRGGCVEVRVRAQGSRAGKLGNGVQERQSCRDRDGSWDIRGWRHEVGLIGSGLP